MANVFYVFLKKNMVCSHFLGGNLLPKIGCRPGRLAYEEGFSEVGELSKGQLYFDAGELKSCAAKPHTFFYKSSIQHFLNFFPEPQGHGSFLPILFINEFIIPC